MINADAIVTFGTLIGMCYGFWKFLEYNHIDLKKLRSYLKILKGGLRDTCKLIGMILSGVLFSIFRVLFSLSVFMWKLYLLITVPMLCMYLHLKSYGESISAVDIENIKAINQYFEFHLVALDLLADMNIRVFFFAVATVFLFGSMTNLDELTKFVENAIKSYFDELNKRVEEFRNV